MEPTGKAYHSRSCPYFAAINKRKEAKGWPGPVFANKKDVGWIKLNAVNACTRCRIRHVKCSLAHTGGPCTHCKKRRELCEVLGWQFQPNDLSKTIYKYVLPPPRAPSPTPQRSATDALLNEPFDAMELCKRLEQLSPRRLALLWPWGPDDHEPFYPIGPQFGEDYHEQCWAYCPQRQLTELGLQASLERNVFLSSGSLQPEYEPSSSGSYPPRMTKGPESRYCLTQASEGNSNSHDSGSQGGAAADIFDLSRNEIPHRMSLGFILNSNEPSS